VPDAAADTVNVRCAACVAAGPERVDAPQATSTTTATTGTMLRDPVTTNGSLLCFRRGHHGGHHITGRVPRKRPPSEASLTDSVGRADFFGCVLIIGMPSRRQLPGCLRRWSQAGRVRHHGSVLGLVTAGS
jgi:hypothetical protein